MNNFINSVAFFSCLSNSPLHEDFLRIYQENSQIHKEKE